MKLERLNKSEFPHDSFGELTFYIQFEKQVKSYVFIKLTNYLYEEVRSASIRRPILEYFEAGR
jgi:hypothetical protein